MLRIILMNVIIRERRQAPGDFGRVHLTAGTVPALAFRKGEVEEDGVERLDLVLETFQPLVAFPELVEVRATLVFYAALQGELRATLKDANAKQEHRQEVLNHHRHHF